MPVGGVVFDNTQAYTGDLTSYVLVTCVVADMGGLIFGYDIGISGIVFVFATIVSMYGVDKWGQRFLFLEGGIQMFICQIVVTGAIASKFGVDGIPGELPKWHTIVVVTFICIYVEAFGWSWGPLRWLYPSEIFPLGIRSAAQSINVSVNMFFTFLVAQLSREMLCHLKFGLFLFFGAFVLVMSVLVYYFVPETKGIPIEEMGLVWKSHWYWSRFVGEDDFAISADKTRHV